MNTKEAVNVSSQWKDAKISGGSTSELNKAVAQIRSQVKDERKIFSLAAPTSGTKDKSRK